MIDTGIIKTVFMVYSNECFWLMELWKSNESRPQMPFAEGRHSDKQNGWNATQAAART